MKNPFYSLLLPVLLLLSCPTLAHAQAFTSYFTGDTADVTVTTTGGIVLMGGATESDEAMVWFLQRAVGGDILVLRASGSDGYNNYLYSQLGVSVNSVETIVFNNATAASDPYVLQQIANADAIWIAGGDQYNYVTYWKDNAVEDLLNAHHNTLNRVIGGTSAGMAILGGDYFSAANGTITSANALNNPFDANVTLGSGDFLNYPILENVITDTHYDDPDRKGRHTTFLARLAQQHNARSFGIACDEYTAVCIDENGIARAYGDYPTYNDNVYFLQANCVAPFLPETLSAGQPLTWNRNGEAVKVYTIKGTVTGSNTFDLNDWVTGSGGNWENWYVNNGQFFGASGTAPNCPITVLEPAASPNTLIYPNPGNGLIRFAQDLNPGNPGSLLPFMATVQDLQGRTIWQERVSENQQIDLTHLQEGVYILILKFEDGNEKVIQYLKID